MSIKEKITCDYDVPRPAVRLWITLSLGILGTWFCGVTIRYFPIPFIGVKGTAIGGWIVIMLLGVLLLRCVEKSAFPLHLPKDKPGKQTWVKKLLRHMAFALAAPYFLYASRPAGGDGTSSLITTFTRAAFAVFPFFFAMGIAFCLEQHYFRQIGFLFFSLSIWTWLGCALLFLLSPPLEYPHIPKIGDILETCKLGVLLTAVLIVMALVLLILSFPPTFLELFRSKFLGMFLFTCPLLFFFACTWLPCPLLLLLSPAPEDLYMPNHLEARKASPLRIAIAMTVALISLASYGFYPFLSLVTGRLFNDHFSHANAGFALDQPTIGKLFLFFTIFTVTIFFFVIVARGMSDRQTRSGFWAFAIPTVLVSLCLLSILTDVFYTLILYIRDMGFTPRRVYGLFYGLIGYIIVLVFLCWATWPPNKKSCAKTKRYKGDTCLPITATRLPVLTSCS